MAQQQKANDEQQRKDLSEIEAASNSLSVISIESDDGRGDGQTANRLPSTHSSVSSSSSPPLSVQRKRPPPIRPMTAPLAQLKTVADIESCLDRDLHQLAILEELEDKWFKISSNLASVVDHLQECSNQVTNASSCCLETMMDSVNITCDKAEEEIKGLHKLMVKCDELATKLTVASSFCDEIKTLRKSVETLEQLYKTKPQQVNQQQRT